jgi:hypothetical protein
MEPQNTPNTQMKIVLVELKAAKETDDIHRAQCLNFLKATGLHL